MSRNPFLPLEGIMIAAMAMESTAAFIYIRGEYVEEFAAMSAAIRALYEAKILGDNALGFNRRFDITIQQGAGAYICGEESGMLESMEGRKGQPRKRPPFPAQARTVGPADHGRQRRDALARAGDRDARRGMVHRRRSPEQPPATRCSA